MGINWPGYMLGGCVRTARGSLVQLHLLPLTLVKCPLPHAWPQCRLVPCIRASLHACNPMFHTRPICSPCAHPLQLQDNADPGRQGHPPDQLARCGWAHTRAEKTNSVPAAAFLCCMPSGLGAPLRRQPRMPNIVTVALLSPACCAALRLLCRLRGRDQRRCGRHAVLTLWSAHQHHPLPRGRGGGQQGCCLVQCTKLLKLSCLPSAAVKWSGPNF